MALLAPDGRAPWPVKAGMYSPPNPPWPEVTQFVRGTMGEERTSYGPDASVPSVGFMRLATQVGVMIHGPVAWLLTDEPTPWGPPRYVSSGVGGPSGVPAEDDDGGAGPPWSGGRPRDT
jgi:hypothetical protein